MVLQRLTGHTDDNMEDIEVFIVIFLYVVPCLRLCFIFSFIPLLFILFCFNGIFCGFIVGVSSHVLRDWAL